MTILPKKHKPPGSSSSANPSGSGVGSTPNEGDSGSGAPGEQEENQVSVSVNPTSSSWVASGAFDASPNESSSSWNSASSNSPSRWPSNGNSSTAEKRPASSSVVSFDYESDCGPSVSKRRMRGSSKSSSALVGGKRHKSSSVSSSVSNLVVSVPLSRSSPSPPLPNVGTSDTQDGDGGGGYNSEDEYSHLGLQLTEQEWEEKDRRFEKNMKKKGYIIKPMADDGSCLFRAVADQIYGDQEMHGVVRAHCMNYIQDNGDYFSHYITEDIDSYVSRKRYHGVHGNHLEIQALSEMYNRPIHIYCYSLEPINIFQNFKTDQINVPVRLSYHRAVHYNSIVDPYKATIGVGLGLPGHKPGAADRNLLGQAFKASEETLVEQVMLEDKIKTTDWEATNEAIEEQVARESYLQWLRDNERRNLVVKKTTSSTFTSSSATVTSGELRSPSGTASPKACCSKHLCSANSSVGSPKSTSRGLNKSPSLTTSDRDSPKPGSSQQRSPLPHTGNPSSSDVANQSDYGFGEGFRLCETESFLNGLPPSMFGLENWSETDVLAQVLAASQQEYLDSLKKQRRRSGSKSPSPPKT